MRKSRFTKAQIIGMINQQEAGMLTAEVCGTHGLDQGSFCKYRSRQGGVNMSDVGKR